MLSKSPHSANFYSVIAIRGKYICVPLASIVFVPGLIYGGIG